MGRTKGSKNRSKEEIQAERELKASQPKRGRGRPRGGLNKAKMDDADTAKKQKAVAVKRGRGRPYGSKGSYTVSEKALAQRRNNFAMPVPQTDEERDYNSRLIGHIMQINEIATHADRHDLLSLRSCFLAYLQLCQKNGFNVSNLSAYASMGFDFYSFASYCRKDDPEVKAFCRFVKETCAMFREHMVSDNKLNPVIGIFWQRNFDGLRNDTEQVQSAQEQEDDNYGSNQSYKDKYKKLIGG